MSHNRASEEWIKALREACLWVARHHEHETAAATLPEFEVWLRAHPLHAKAYEHARRTVEELRPMFRQVNRTTHASIAKH